jgi:hypothetical protein
MALKPTNPPSTFQKEVCIRRRKKREKHVGFLFKRNSLFLVSHNMHAVNSPIAQWRFDGINMFPEIVLVPSKIKWLNPSIKVMDTFGPSFQMMDPFGLWST